MLIQGFSELIEKIDALLHQNQARIEADAAINQTQLEVLATLQALIRSQGVTKSQQLDLTPLKTVLTEISDNTQPRVLAGYEFEVTDRDRLGDIAKLRVTPVSPTRH